MPEDGGDKRGRGKNGLKRGCCLFCFEFELS